jgi:hypothetical protein
VYGQRRQGVSRVLPAVTPVHKYCYGSEPELQVLRFVEVVEVQVRYEILKSLHHRLWVLLELSLEPNKATIVPPRSFHTNINYFRGTVKKKKILREEVQNVKQTKLINSTV